MATEIKMPQLSDTMDAGKILVWHKKEGDTVKRGDVLAEVETDKANLEIESFQSGTLIKIITAANERAVVGQAIALIGEAGEKASATAQSTPSSASETTPAKPPANPVEAPPSSEPSTPAPTKGATPSSESENNGRLKASPLARKLAQERHIDLSVLQGSGPAGRIVRNDVDAAPTPSSVATPSAEKQQSRPSSQQEARRTPTESGAGTLNPMSSMRQTIARRMQESVTQAPHFYVTSKIRMREALKLRETLKLRSEFKGISVNHLIVKATAYALEREPRVNRSVKDGQIFTPSGINIGVITSVEDGLLIPVVHDANTLPLKDLVFEVNAAIERARAGRPSSSDLLGGTFSISNMGMFDVENFTAIINPGQGAVLAISAVQEEALVDQGQIVVGKTMKVTLSIDHRIIDGVMGATFLKHFKEALEIPSLLLL